METARNTPEAEPVPAPGPAPEPAAVPVPGPASAPPADPAAPKARRRGGRTAALLAVAAVLGIVGGTAVGYGIQADREPTPLPALNQTDLAYPAKPAPKGQEPAPLSAAEDRGLKTDGDLRKLLLPKPAGAKDADFVPEDNWMSVASYAGEYDHPSVVFEEFLGDGIRRVATTGWRTGQYKSVQINLVQFRPEYGAHAAETASDQREYLADEFGYGTPIKGSGEGRTYLLPVEREEGYLDLYVARAVFHRGDVMVEIFVSDTKKVSQKEISSLAERQLGRL
ncbi:hypothetical protein [Streptomyces sp. NPDC127092]|uniref:hypothetical protein n=1 Tax=Streptomyces sp. NPDC127092 TaxID=3347135 RepID=UPI00364B5279